MSEAFETHFIGAVNAKFGLKIETPAQQKPLATTLGENITDNIATFVETIQNISPYHVSAPAGENFLVTWLSCGYTIESLEMLLRATDKPLKGEISIRYTSCLSGLVRLSGVLCARNAHLNVFLLTHLKSLFNFLCARDSACVLVWDVFGLMVMLVFTTRAVLAAGRGEAAVPKGENLEHSIVKSVFLATIARIVIGYDVASDMDVDETSCAQEEENENLMEFYKKFNIYRVNEAATKVTTNNLVEQIKYQCQTFLRCSCLLFHFMTDVELPEEMSYLGGKWAFRPPISA